MVVVLVRRNWFVVVVAVVVVVGFVLRGFIPSGGFFSELFILEREGFVFVAGSE